MKKPSEENASGFSYGYVIVALAVLNLTAAVGFGRFAFTALLPTMRDSLGLNNTGMGLISGAGMLSYLVATVPSGMLAVRIGSRLAIAIGLQVCGVSMILLGTVNDLFMAALLMAALGVGCAIATTPGLGVTAAWFEGKKRAYATGITLGGPGLGMALTGIIIPLILSNGSENAWRQAWYCVGGGTMFIGFLFCILYRNSPQAIAGKGAQRPSVKPEPKERRPSGTWSAVYKEPEMWRLCVLTFIFGLTYITYGTFFMAFAQEEVGLNELRAGNLWSLVGFLTIFSGFIGGLLADRFGRHLAYTILFGCLGISLALSAVSNHLFFIHVSAVLYSLSIWGFPAILAIACVDLFGPRLAPSAIGLGALSFSLGQAIGPVFAGGLYDVTRSFTIPFLGSAAMTGVGVVLCWVKLSRRRPSSGR